MRIGFFSAVHCLLFLGGEQKGGAVILIALMAHTGQNQLQNDLIVEYFFSHIDKIRRYLEIEKKILYNEF